MNEPKPPIVEVLTERLVEEINVNIRLRVTMRMMQARIDELEKSKQRPSKPNGKAKDHHEQA